MQKNSNNFDLLIERRHAGNQSGSHSQQMFTANEASIRDFKSIVTMPPLRNEHLYQQCNNHASSVANLPVIQQKILAKNLQTITSETDKAMKKPVSACET